MPSAGSTFGSCVTSVFVLIALSACGTREDSISVSGGAGQSSANPAPPTISVVTTSQGTPKVSYETICPDLIKHGTAAADLVTEFVADPQALADKSAATTARFDGVIEDFDYDVAAAPTGLMPFLKEQIATMIELRDYLKVGGSRNTDFRKFKSAGVEIVNQCKLHL